MNKSMHSVPKDFLNDPYFTNNFKKRVKYTLGIKNIYKMKKLFNLRTSVFSKEVISKGIIFIHIPKAAGTSVSNELYGSRQGHYMWSTYAKLEPSLFKDFIKITFVRDPYSRLLSAYFYLQSSPHSEDRMFFDLHLSKYKSFDDFVINWVNDETVKKWKHFYPQTEFIFDENNNQKVDFIGHVESMNEDIAKVNQLFCLNLTVKEFNKSDKPQLNISEKAKSIIYKVYKKDFNLLGYSK